MTAIVSTDRLIELAERELAAWRAHDGVIRAELAGSLRRKAKEPNDIDIVALVDPAMDWEFIAESYELGMPGLTEPGVRVDVVPTTETHWGAAMMFLTGPRSYNTWLRDRAKAAGLVFKWNGDKIVDHIQLVTPADEIISTQTEEAFCAAIGIPLLPPEKR